MVKYVVQIFNHPNPDITRLEGPFEDKEFALKYAREMTKLWGLAYVRTVYEPKVDLTNN